MYDKNKKSYDKSQLLLFIILSVRNKGEKEINYAKILKSKIPLRDVEEVGMFPKPDYRYFSLESILKALIYSVSHFKLKLDFLYQRRLKSNLGQSGTF